MSHHSFALSFLASLPKNMVICAMIMICSLGENRNTRGCQKLKWACFRSLTPPEVSWWLDQWGNGPPKLLLASLGEQKSGRCRQRLKATSSSKPFSKWPFMQPVAVPASAVVFIWWHLIEKVIFSLYKNKVWASCNTGTKDTLYSQDWFHSLGRYETRFSVSSISL